MAVFLSSTCFFCRTTKNKNIKKSYILKAKRFLLMTGNWILKVREQNNKKKQAFLKRYFIKKSTKYQNHYYINTYIEKPKKEIKKLKLAGICYSCYRVEYERSANYRTVFFQRTQGPYRCRYCNKQIKKSDVFVDHIIPVSQAQKRNSARALLSIHGCSNVNDIKNLAPACRRCNLKKSDKMGLWILRGHLGAYKAYWVSIYILFVLFILFAVFGVISFFLMFQSAGLA